jgi:hypothetical protein
MTQFCDRFKTDIKGGIRSAHREMPCQIPGLACLVDGIEIVEQTGLSITRQSLVKSYSVIFHQIGLLGFLAGVLVAAPFSAGGESN